MHRYLHSGYFLPEDNLRARPADITLALFSFLLLPVPLAAQQPNSGTTPQTLSSRVEGKIKQLDQIKCDAGSTTADCIAKDHLARRWKLEFVQAKEKERDNLITICGLLKNSTNPEDQLDAATISKQLSDLRKDLAAMGHSTASDSDQDCVLRTKPQMQGTPNPEAFGQSDPAQQSFSGKTDAPPPVQDPPPRRQEPAQQQQQQESKQQQGGKNPNTLVPLQAVTGKVLSLSTGVPLQYVQIGLRSGQDYLARAVTDQNGHFTMKVVKPADYTLEADCRCGIFEEQKNIPISILKDKDLEIPDILLEDKIPVQSFRTQEDISRLKWGELVRTISGFEQSGASASKSKQNFFYDMYISTPFPLIRHWDPDFGPRLRTWGGVRVASAPRDFSLPVREFVATFAQQVGETKVSEIAQSSEFLVGLENTLGGIRRLLPSFDQTTRQKFSFGLIAAFGGITPLRPQDTITVFNATPDAIKQFNLPSGTQFIAFVSPDRDRFFREYSAGFRLKTYYFSLTDRPLYRFPAILDVTYGINESVTRGRVRGGVFRFDGFYPLPWNAAKFIFLYGTALLKPARARITNPMILSPAPSGTPVPGTNTAIVTIPQIDRDYYRFGVGVDAISLFKTIFDAGVAKKSRDAAAEDTKNRQAAQAQGASAPH